MHDAGPDRYDIHPVVRAAAYRRLSDPARTHSHLADYFAQARPPAQITRIEELQPAIERYHHLVRAHRYEEAYGLLSDRLVNQLRDRFADQQLLMQLLRGLFNGTRPCLDDPRDRAWAVEALARACSYSGETRRAVALCEANVTAFASSRCHDQLAMVLETLAGVQMRLGAVRKAEQKLRRLVDLTTSLQRTEQEAVARNRLGLLLAHRGLFDESLQQLDMAYELVKHLSDRQIQSVCFSYYTQRALLMHDPESALEAAQKSRALVEEAARRTEPNEHDYVRSGWLLGAACLAMARAGKGEKKGHLDQAQRYLDDALSRCRRNDLVGFEPDLLLAWSRWHRLSGDPESAARVARDALAIADRCDYRLKKAEAHNCLAWLAIESGDALTAQGSAEIAWNCADCDGPPWSYKAARDEAESILGALGVKAVPESQPGRSQAA
jgi:tetratricopeptide (TPR) repeat protein